MSPDPDLPGDLQGDPTGNLWEGDEIQAVPRRLDSIRWSDLRGKPVPPVQYDWEPFLTKVAFGIIGAGPGHGKSILIVQIAVGKATGLPVLGYPIGPIGSVGIVALEDDENVLHRRIAAAVDSYGPKFTEEHHRLLDANLRTLVRARSPLAYLNPESLDLALAGLVGEIEQEMATCEAKPALVFLDTLNAVHGGDENSAQETRPLAAAIFGLHARLACSVWALHHLAKTGTSRNAPLFTDRMDPTLVRGSGAIVGSSRAVVQFGWIYPKEASKVGLEPDGATRRYAVMGLTKVNDGPPSPWVLLEHSQNAGLWVVVPNGAAILAKLKGAESILKATSADLVLLAIHEAGVAGQPFDRKEVAKRLFADNKDPSSSLRTYLRRLALDRLISSDKGGLTEMGMRRVRELLDSEEDPIAG